MTNPFALYVIGQQRQHELRAQNHPSRRPRPPSVGRRLLVVTAFVVAAMVLLSIVPAGAESSGWYDARDPVADSGAYPKHDIVHIRIGNRQQVTLRLDTRQGADPATDPGWRNGPGGTRILWKLNTDGDPAPEFRLGIASTSAGPSVPALIDLTTGVNTCTPDFTFSHQNRYVVTFDRSCIGSVSQFSARVHYRYQPPHGEARIDIAPNGHYTPPVVSPDR
jgi:hypothetical protein